MSAKDEIRKAETAIGATSFDEPHQVIGYLAERLSRPQTRLTEADAVTIILLNMVCVEEGVGPDATDLLGIIAEQYPSLPITYPYAEWPKAVADLVKASRTGQE